MLCSNDSDRLWPILTLRSASPSLFAAQTAPPLATKFFRVLTDHSAGDLSGINSDIQRQPEPHPLDKRSEPTSSSSDPRRPGSNFHLQFSAPPARRSDWQPVRRLYPSFAQFG